MASRMYTGISQARRIRVARTVPNITARQLPERALPEGLVTFRRDFRRLWLIRGIPSETNRSLDVKLNK